MASIHFDITGDNTNIVNAFNGVREASEKTRKAVEQAGVDIDKVFRQAAAAKDQAASSEGLTRQQAALKALGQSLQEYAAWWQKIKDMQGSLSGKIALSTNWGAISQEASELGSSIAGIVSRCQQAGVSMEELNGIFLSTFSGNQEVLHLFRDALSGIPPSVEQCLQSAQEAYSVQGMSMKQLEKMIPKVEQAATWYGEMLDKSGGKDIIFGETFDESVKRCDTLVEYLKEMKDRLQGMKEAAAERADMSFWDKVKEGAASATASVKSYASSLLEAATGHGKLQQHMADFRTALDSFGLPLSAATASVGKMTTALIAMCATPIGAVITGIVATLAAMKKHLTSSAEGQEVLAEGSAVLSSLLASLGDVVVRLGSFLVHCFTDADGPMRAFAKNLVAYIQAAVESVMGILDGLGYTLKGIFTLSWTDFKKGMSELYTGLARGGDAIIASLKTNVSLITGAAKTLWSFGTNESLSAGITKDLTQAIPKARQAYELTKKQWNAERGLSKEKVKQKEAELEIAELREKVYTLTGEDKQKALTELYMKQKSLYEGQAKIQEEMLSVQKERNRLHTSTIEDLEKEHEMEAGILSLRVQQAASLRFTRRMMVTTDKQVARGDTGSSSRSSSSSRRRVSTDNRVTESISRYADTVEKAYQEETEAARALEEKITQARIDAMVEGGEKTRVIREKEHKKVMDDLRQEYLEALDAEKERQRSIYDAAQDVIKANGGKITPWSDSMLEGDALETITDQYDLLMRLEDEKYHEEQRKAERDSLLAYLNEYGDYQQKKLAIAEEYASKIAAAETVGEKLSLSHERDETMTELSSDSLIKSFDWRSFGSRLADYTEEYLQGLRKKLNEALDSGLLTEEDAKDLSARLEEIDNALIGKQEEVLDAFGLLIPAIEEQKKKTMAAAMAQEAYDKALATSMDARAQEALALEELLRVLKSAGVDTGGSTSMAGMIDLFQAGGGSMEELTPVLENFMGASQGATSAASGLSGAAQSLGGAMSAAGGSFGGTVAIVDAIIHKINENVQSLPELVEVTGLTNTSFGRQMNNFAKGSQAVVNGWDNLKSGNVIGMVANVIEGVQYFGRNLEETGLVSFHGNKAEVEKLTERNTKAIERNTAQVEDLTDVIGDSAGAKSLQAYTLAYAAQQKTNELALETLRAQMNYHSAHHSNAYYASDRHIAKLVGSVRKDTLTGTALEGVSITSLDDLLSMTPEQLKAVRDYLPELWKYLITVGEYDKSEYWLDVVEQADKLDELTEQINENLTQTSVSSLRDGFVSALTDMESDAADMGEDIGDALFKSVVNAFILDDAFDEWLDSFYTSWRNKIKSGNMSKAEWDALNSEYKEKVDELYGMRDSLADSLGYTGSSEYEQSGGSSSWQSMGQETAEELNGRFTALQISGDAAAAAMTQVAGNILAMAAVQMTASSTLSEQRNLLIMGNSYLEDVAKYTKNIFTQFGTKIDAVVANTNKL